MKFEESGMIKERLFSYRNVVEFCRKIVYTTYLEIEPARLEDDKEV